MVVELNDSMKTKKIFFIFVNIVSYTKHVKSVFARYRQQQKGYISQRRVTENLFVSVVEPRPVSCTEEPETALGSEHV